MVDRKSNIKKGFKSMGDVLGKIGKPSSGKGGGKKKSGDDYFTQDKYISREWQGYAVKLSEELNDKRHISWYMKMARDMDRAILEQARRFVKDAIADNKAKLFMWKVGQLNKDKRSRDHKIKKSNE